MLQKNHLLQEIMFVLSWKQYRRAATKGFMRGGALSGAYTGGGTFKGGGGT